MQYYVVSYIIYDIIYVYIVYMDIYIYIYIDRYIVYDWIKLNIIQALNANFT